MSVIASTYETASRAELCIGGLNPFDQMTTRTQTLSRQLLCEWKQTVG